MRKVRWQTELWNYLSDARERSFEWGTHDCGTFALGAVNAVLAEPLKLEASWATKEGATFAVERSGSLHDLVTQHLGKSVPYSRCSAGDVVMADWGQGQGLCVHDGVQLLAPSRQGLRKVPFKCAIVGWRVE